MANYPIKVLVDEKGQEFIPISSTNALLDPTGQNLDTILASKLETNSIIAGSGITLNKNTTNHIVEINCSLPGASVIDNLTTTTAGQGSLDAHQGYVLNTTKVNISDIVNNVTSTDADKPLSAYQGYILFNKFNNYTPSARLATVATSGNYNDLSNKPNIPTKISDLTNDAGYTSNTDLLNLIYPVGSIYMSVNNTSPAILFGGSWEQLKDRFLLGAGGVYTAGNTGGEATHDHFYSVGYRPYYGSLVGDDADAIMLYNYRTASWTKGIKDTGDMGIPGSNIINKGITDSHYTKSADKYSVGSYTNKVSNIPPYYAVYMWKRTA